MVIIYVLFIRRDRYYLLGVRILLCTYYWERYDKVMYIYYFLGVDRILKQV